MAIDKGLREKLAKIIYDFEGGIWPEDYEAIFKEPKTKWEDLEEWERDDRRLQARQVIKYLITGKTEPYSKENKKEIKSDEQRETVERSETTRQNS